MYNVEKSFHCSGECGWLRETRRLYIYIYIYIRYRNKMAALGYAYTLGKQTSRSRKRCTAQNTTGACFLEVQIPPRTLVYDWDPLVSCVKC